MLCPWVIVLSHQNIFMHKSASPLPLPQKTHTQTRRPPNIRNIFPTISPNTQTNTANAEKFFLCLAAVPRLEARLQCFQIALEFDAVASEWDANASTLERAIQGGRFVKM
jgi:hypothetical protein